MSLQSLRHELLTGGGEPLAEPTADPFQQPWKAEGTPAACLALALVACWLPSPLTAAFLFAVPSAFKSPSLQTNLWGSFSSICRTAFIRSEPYSHQEHEQPSDQFSSVTQSCLTLCDPLDCSMPGFPFHQQLPKLCSNSCPLSWWCHPTISSSVVPSSSCLQSFPASGSFLMSQFTPGGQIMEFQLQHQSFK